MARVILVTGGCETVDKNGASGGTESEGAREVALFFERNPAVCLAALFVAAHAFRHLFIEDVACCDVPPLART